MSYCTSDRPPIGRCKSPLWFSYSWNLSTEERERERLCRHRLTMTSTHVNKHTLWHTHAHTHTKQYYIQTNKHTHRHVLKVVVCDFYWLEHHYSAVQYLHGVKWSLGVISEIRHTLGHTQYQNCPCLSLLFSCCTFSMELSTFWLT